MEKVGKVFFKSSSSNSSQIKQRTDNNNNFHFLGEEEFSYYHCSDVKDDCLKQELELPADLSKRLFEHQKIGVNWLYKIFQKKSGGILGDDMGLGKTFQVSCLLTGLLLKNEIKRVLVLCPVSVLANWQRELSAHLKKYVKNANIEIVSSEISKKKRIDILESTFSGGSLFANPTIIISSYHLVSSMIDEFSRKGCWDYVILDEGHVIKNPSTKISKSMYLIDTNHRLLLTGTPIQNNLTEFWAIVRWVTNGERFGSLAYFKENVIKPIIEGQNPNASSHKIAKAEEAANFLKSIIKPIFLQRKKKDQPAQELKLPKKVEMVLWIPLSTQQREIYTKFLETNRFNSAFDRSNCPVEVINYLKTICRHPFIIEASEMKKKKTKLSMENRLISDLDCEDDEDDIIGAISSSLNSMSISQIKGKPIKASSLSKQNVFDIAERDPDVRELLKGSVKLRVLAKLTYRLTNHGHKTLIFSQSRLMLDLIQRVLAEYNLPSSRIDGCVVGKERQRIIDEFNANDEDSYAPPICLLTTRACGFGINLTGADRVIIYDPSWNPAEDRQAIDRAYRIGQTNDVVVYRMIMSSCVEEKMYEKQVFKDGLRVISENGIANRYFSNEETKELFKLGPHKESVVMNKLNPSNEFVDTHGELQGVLGYTRHDTLYEEGSSCSEGSTNTGAQNNNILSFPDRNKISEARKHKPKQVDIRNYLSTEKENVQKGLENIKDISKNVYEKSVDNLKSPIKIEKKIKKKFKLIDEEDEEEEINDFEKVEEARSKSKDTLQDLTNIEYQHLNLNKSPRFSLQEPKNRTPLLKEMQEPIIDLTQENLTQENLDECTCLSNRPNEIQPSKADNDEDIPVDALDDSCGIEYDRVEPINIWSSAQEEIKLQDSVDELMFNSEINDLLEVNSLSRSYVKDYNDEKLLKEASPLVGSKLREIVVTPTIPVSDESLSLELHPDIDASKNLERLSQTSIIKSDIDPSNPDSSECSYTCITTDSQAPSAINNDFGEEEEEEEEDSFQLITNINTLGHVDSSIDFMNGIKKSPNNSPMDSLIDGVNTLQLFDKPKDILPTIPSESIPGSFLNEYTYPDLFSSPGFDRRQSRSSMQSTHRCCSGSKENSENLSIFPQPRESYLVEQTLKNKIEDEDKEFKSMNDKIKSIVSPPSTPKSKMSLHSALANGTVSVRIQSSIKKKSTNNRTSFATFLMTASESDSESNSESDGERSLCRDSISSNCGTSFDFKENSNKECIGPLAFNMLNEMNSVSVEDGGFRLDNGHSLINERVCQDSQAYMRELFKNENSFQELEKDREDEFVQHQDYTDSIEADSSQEPRLSLDFVETKEDINDALNIWTLFI